MAGSTPAELPGKALPRQVISSGEQPPSLALARLAVGRNPGHGSTHLVHAVAALGEDRAAEAEHAIVRCRDASATWERTDFAKQLNQLTVARPDQGAAAESHLRASSCIDLHDDARTAVK